MRRPPAVSFAVFAALFCLLALRAAWEWRFFAQFLGDDGWTLRVAERLAAGEALYTDVGYVYGPLPVYVLSLLFRVALSAAWVQVLQFFLAAAATGAVYAIARMLAGSRTALWMVAWAALLGAPASLFTFILTAYTSAVAWGATTSLLATAACCAWVGSRSVPTLVAALLLALLSVLSKPEYGLAAAGVLAAAVYLQRPARGFVLGAAASALGLFVVVGLGTDVATLTAWWRGYSGYDLLREGTVTLAHGPRLLGGLFLCAWLGLTLWARGSVGIVPAAGWVLGGIWLGQAILRGLSSPFLLSSIAASAWAGVLPALLLCGWRARGSSLPRVFWVVWMYAVLVNLRSFPVGSFCPAAAGPVAALAFVLVRQRAISHPTQFGLVMAGIIVALTPLEAELFALFRPKLAERVATRMGAVRVPSQAAARIGEMRAHLEEAPAGPLFVAGAGPGWYLLGERANPTRFECPAAGNRH